jgi:uncharacterized protein (DUF1501 family)
LLYTNNRGHIMRHSNHFHSSQAVPARRQFLTQAAALGALGLLGSGSARAASPVTDYKALICVYLFGGNDGNNLIVPLDPTHASQYNTIRAPAGLALSNAANTLLPAHSTVLQSVPGASGSPGTINQPFAFHYGIPELDALYAQGQMAVVLNVGSLRQPLTKAQYLAGTGIPAQLFSHSDQTLQMQAGSPAMAGTGWGGRLLDALGTGGHLDSVSVGSNGLFVSGNANHGNLLPDTGQLDLAGMNFYPQSEADTRRAALLQILNFDSGNQIANAANRALANGIDLVADLKAANASGALRTAFPGTSLGNQLKTVTQLIKMRASQGPGRQVYFVSQGGFDTHGGQSYQQFAMLSQVSQALGAFQTALAEINAAQQVTSFTLSDFGRTLQPNSSGTDHAWGNHQLVFGAAVKGGVYGQFPDFVLGGKDDATGRGAWIPQFSNQQFGATLGKWFGADAATLANSVFKNELGLFGVTDLGFMG